MQFRQTAIYIAIFGVALAARFLFLFQLRESPYFDNLIIDSASYDQWGLRIAQGDILGTTVFYQSPLYPYFLGLVYSIFGQDYMAARLIQAVIGAGNAVLLAVLSTRLFSRSTGVVAGLTAALYGTFIFQDLMLLKSVIVIFFILLSFLFLERASKGESRLPLLFSGLFYGVAICGRGNLLFAVPLFLGWLALRDPTPPRLAIMPAAVFLLGTIIAISPVTLRNKLVGDDWVLIESDAGINLYVGNHANATGIHQPPAEIRTIPEYEETDAREYAEQEMGRTLKPSEVSRFWIDRAILYALSAPIDEVKLIFRKFMLAMNHYEVPDNYNQYYFGPTSWLFRGYLPAFIVIVPFAVLGLLGAARKWRQTGFLHLYVFAYLFSLLVLYVTSRYRLPIMVGLIPFSAHGMVETVRAFRANGWSGLRVPAVIVISVALLSSVTVLDPVGFAKQESEIAGFYTRLGDHDAAERAYERALGEAGPAELHLVYFNMGVYYSDTGRLEDAVDSLEKSVAANPSFNRAQVKLAKVRRRIETCPSSLIALGLGDRCPE